MWDLVTWIPKELWALVVGRRQLQVLMHRAAFAATGRQCYFINVTNLSRDRDVEVTHVWIDTNPPQHASVPDRPLPKRLRPDETWETWVEAERLPPTNDEQAFALGRVRLSTGHVFKSRKNLTVPDEGMVPGEPITQPPRKTRAD